LITLFRRPHAHTMVYYAVAKGRNIGIFTTWAECQQSVKGFKNALYRKTETREEAVAFIAPQELFEPAYYVYTDGSCLHNGQKNASAGIGIFFGLNDPRNVSKCIEGKQTNNTAELSAIIETYSILEEDIQKGVLIVIASDSEYAIRCASSYGMKCESQGWPDIPNRELVQRVYGLYRDKPNVRFLHVKAHTGKKDVHSIGNAYADQLAGEASMTMTMGK
jgi:ribonuclease HI